MEAKLAAPRTFAKPKIDKRIAKYPKDDWLLKLLAAMTRLEQRCAVLFTSFSAARATEVIGVLCRHYDPVAGRVTLENTKPGVSREIQLPPFVNEALKLLPMDDPEAPLFGYASRFSLTRIIKRACKRAGIKYFSPHKVGRHAFAARFLADGHSIKALWKRGLEEPRRAAGLPASGAVTCRPGRGWDLDAAPHSFCTVDRAGCCAVIDFAGENADSQGVATALIRRVS